MKKIGIFCLSSRRVEFVVAHAYELSKCKYDNFQFYLLGNGNDSVRDTLVNILGERVSIYEFDYTSEYNYMMKVVFALNCNHEFSIKHDEDCYMTSASWDKFFANIENMTNDDLLCTGAISSGIPTVEMFLENHTPEIKEDLFDIFKNTKLDYRGGADYTKLNIEYESWNPDIFYELVKNFNHHYKGIHPIRINFPALKKINDYILENFNKVMSVKDCPIIKDNSKYPYFCNNTFGIRTEDWKKVVSSRELYVDNFDEVPLNRYRELHNKNFVFDTGIPIIHTMYNWSPEFMYEKQFIQNIMRKVFT